MRTNIRRTALAALAAGLLCVGLAKADDKGIFKITLRFMPQESVGSSTPTLALGISDRPIQLSIEDGRTVPDPIVIGESTDDDDRPWPVHATNDVAAWANEVLLKAAADWGIRIAADAPLALTGKLTRFHIMESNKPVGSVYNADVRVAFQLKNSQGQLLWEGTAPGDATRYGKKRSADNANEVLSDAIKEAYATLIADAALQNAWLGKSGPVAGASPAPPPPSGPAMSPSDLLTELVKLKKQGFTTDLLVDYVNQKALSSALTADDMVKWKQAGMPQEVIKAALAKSGS
jgi:hypothetical protein